MKINQAILKKYALGKCSDDEAKLVEEWIADTSWNSIDESNPVKDEIGDRIWAELTKPAKSKKKKSAGESHRRKN